MPWAGRWWATTSAATAAARAHADGCPRRNGLLVDLATVIDAVRASHRGPLVLLGHSLGGLVAARFVAGGIGVVEPWFREIDALVLSSPALDPGMSAGQKMLLALLGNAGAESGGEQRPRSRTGSRATRQVVQRYVADPLVHDRVTPRLVRFILDGGAVVRERAATWQVPTLLMWAGSDRCVAPAGSAAFAAAAPGAVLRAHEFEPLFHEIFNEPEQAEVFAVLDDWLAMRVASWQPARQTRYREARPQEQAMKIAFFGTGLMGAGFVRRARANGIEVNVWNRSAEKARALEAHGAKAFDDAAAALAGAERIHLSLADDASVDAVLEPLAPAIPKATWIVDHTTTAVTPTAERVARWNARGHTLRARAGLHGAGERAGRHRADARVGRTSRATTRCCRRCRR